MAMMNMSGDHGSHHDHLMHQETDHASMNHHMDRGGISPDHSGMDHSAHQAAAAAVDGACSGGHMSHGMSVGLFTRALSVRGHSTIY